MGDLLRRGCRLGSCVDAPVDARDLLTVPAMIGCRHVSGLVVRLANMPRAGMEIRRPGADQNRERKARCPLIAFPGLDLSDQFALTVPRPPSSPTHQRKRLPIRPASALILDIVRPC